MSEIFTPKKLIDRLTNYAVEDKTDKEKSHTLLAAAQMIRRQKTEIEGLKEKKAQV